MASTYDSHTNLIALVAMFASLFIVFFLVSSGVLVDCTHAPTDSVDQFPEWKVVRVDLVSPKQMVLLSELGLDVWSNDGTTIWGPNDVLVLEDHLKAFRKESIRYKVLVEDVQSLIDKEKREIANTTHGAASWFDSYHRSAEIDAFLRELAAKFPNFAQYIPSIGNLTLEGRNISGLRITSPSDLSQKKKIYVQGGQHAREWIAPATVAYFAQALVEEAAAGDLTLINNFVFDVVPLVNVDGYEYTWTTNRLWRKNKRQIAGRLYGVDLNRNYAGSYWCEYGASKDPSSETYCGTAPFSEPETAAVSGFVLRQGPYVAGFDYHSYGQLIIWPWGYTTSPTPDDEELTKAATGIAAAIRETTGVSYTPQPGWQLYSTTGGINDWFYDPTPNRGAGIKYSFTIELRDKSTFILPPSQILPTARENWAGFKWFLKYLLSKE